MKIKITRQLERSPTTGQKFSYLTNPCPYPDACTVEGLLIKVGSISCDRCKMNKGKNSDHVFCAAGDKRNQLAEVKA